MQYQPYEFSNKLNYVNYEFLPEDTVDIQLEWNGMII